MKKNAKRLFFSRRKNFTVLELVIVISIIIILASLLFPALQRGRELAKQINCVNNMKQIYLGAVSYANSNNDFMPYQFWWSGGIIDELGMTSQYQMVKHSNQTTAYFAFSAKMAGILICPSALAPTSSPVWTGASYNNEPFASSYTPSTKYFNTDYLNEAGKYGGWLANSGGGGDHRVSKRFNKISDNSVIMGEMMYSSIASATTITGGTVDYARPAPHFIPNYIYLTGASAIFDVPWNHAKSSNFLFLAGNVERLKKGQQFNANWQKK